MTPQTILRRIAEYRKELTFPHHQREVEAWEKSVRGAIVRADIGKMDAIKDLLKELKEKIKRCNFLLSHDRELTDKERSLVFERKDIYGWLISFFESAQETLKSAEKTLKGLKK